MTNPTISTPSSPQCHLLFSSLPSYLLIRAVDLLHDNNGGSFDEASLMETLSYLEDAIPSSSNVIECADHFWQSICKRDQEKTNQQWKQNMDCSSRALGRDFWFNRQQARYLSQLSANIFDYGCKPIPYFCPTPTRALDDTHETLERLRPTIWPLSSELSLPQQQFFAFVNLSQHKAGGVWWEGFRPIEALSDSSFQVSLNLQDLIQNLPSTVPKEPLAFYYRLIAMNRSRKTQQAYFVQTSTEGDNGGDDDDDAVLSTISISKCQQLATLMRQLQVTITMDNHKVVVATGGSLRIVSPLCGRFHDRNCDLPSNLDRSKSFSVVSTSFEFHLEGDARSAGGDRLCIKVSRS